MKFAKLCHKLTACLYTLLCTLWLTSCVQSPTSETTFNRSEAVKARLNLALAYLEQNDFPKAKQNIDKALQHDEKDALSHSVLAYYYQQIGENDQAESTYQQALTLSKNSPDILNNYGTFLCRQGKFNEAYQQFEQALASDQHYYHQSDTLENIILCAAQEPNLTKKAEALTQLEKRDRERAQKWR